MLTDELDKIYTKSKYKELFDIAVLSIHSTHRIADGVLDLCKPKAKIWAETGDYMLILKKEQRIELRKKILQMAGDAKLKQVEQKFGHHFLFEKQ